MTQKFLVTYATKYGSTTSIAEAVGAALAEAGALADVCLMNEVSSFDGYDAVIIGSPLHNDEWLPEALAFVKRHEAALKALPVALFVVGLLIEDTPENRESKAKDVRTIRISLGALKDIGVFGGVMDYSKLSALVKMQVKTKSLQEGDFRDLEKVKAWARGVLPQLTA